MLANRSPTVCTRSSISSLYGFGFELRGAADVELMRLVWNKAAGYSLMLRA